MFVPAGYEFEEDSDMDSMDGCGDEPTKANRSTDPVTLSPMELKKKNLLEHLKSNSLDSLRKELDAEPRGFDIDEAVDGHWSLLFNACFLGLPEVVKFLIEERGASSKISVFGETPLMIACYSSADPKAILDIVKSLIERSASISTSNINGITALMFASRQGHLGVVEYLLSLNDSFDAIDNEGNNALFHAIEGKHFEIAKLLIEAGIDITVRSKRGITAKELASNENLEEFLELFPSEPYQYEVPTEYVNYNRFEDLIPFLSQDIPAYFPDVATLLKAMNCEEFIPKFALARVSLEEFLSISDERMEEIGIEFPYQRRRMKFGLFKFQKTRWSNESLFFPPNFETEETSSYELIMMLANVLRQLIVIKAHINLMKQLGEEFDLTRAYRYFNLNAFNEFQGNIKTLKAQLEEMIQSNPPSRPLLITKKKLNTAHPGKNKKRLLIKIGIMSSIPIVALCALKFLLRNK